MKDCCVLYFFKISLNSYSMNENNNNEGRINKLEKRVKELEEKVSLIVRTGGVPAAVKQAEVKKPEKREPGNFSLFINWLREDWLMKLGAFLLILALVWFVTFAFVNNWIGPVGRISLGLLFGVGILAFGHFVIPKRKVPGEVLVVTGMVMLLATIFSGLTFYDFFGAIPSLIMMALVVFLVTTIAIVRNTKALAVVAVVGAAFVPILVDRIFSFEEIVLSYILLVDLGVLLVVLLRGWRILVLLSFLITAIFGSLMFFELYDNDLLIWLFMGLFYFLFLISNVFAILHNKKVTWGDFAVAGLNSTIMLLWIIEFVPEVWQSIVLSGVALVSIISVYLMYRQMKILKKSVYLYGAVALFFVGAATAVELQGMALTIAFFIEIFLGVVLTLYGLRDKNAAEVTSMLFTIPLIMLVSGGSIDYSQWSNVSIFNEHFFAMLIGILTVGSAAYFLRKTSPGKKDEAVTHIAIASVLAVLLLWFSLFNLIDSFNLARGVALVIYTLVGVSLFFYSLKENIKGLRLGSGVLLGAVVLRLLIIEVWEMPLSGRIVTFLLIGALLVTTAFFGKRISS